MTDALDDHFSLVLDAPAKINLALHVVGQRADGHHLLESLVTFADRGDRIAMSPAQEDRFTLSGPFADQLSGADTDGNLVLRARDLLRAACRDRGHAAGPVHLHLEKNLPVASGIGGGSADAAATLKGLMALWGKEAGEALSSCLDLAALALPLGADLPMCLAGRPLIARGIGEAITPVDALPSFPALLVNPRVGVSTPAVFRALTTKIHPPLDLAGGLSGRKAWLEALKDLRNDLEPPARALAPSISDVSSVLRDTKAAVVRMSGSGATCFALFKHDADRDAAARTVSSTRPDWYCLSCDTTSGDVAT